MNVRNYIHLTGNLGAEPTTYVLPSGDLSCKFNLATNEYYRNKAGERATRTEWHTVRAYGKLAQLFAEHLRKGSQISIVGSMRYRKWEDKFEQKRITAEVIASEFTFLSPSKSSDGNTYETDPELAVAAEPTIPQAGEPKATAAKRRKKATSKSSK